MSIENSNPPDSRNISRVAIKPPPFWKVNPTLWFAQLEAQFLIAGVSVDETKFHHVVSAIETDVLNSVADIILKPPQSDKYGALKTRLIALHSESQESKIRTLLQGLELGDQRPSQLLTRMRSLAGENVGETLLKSLWLSRLPATSQSILAALTEDLNNLATVADKISDIAGVQQVNSCTSQTPPSSQLEQQIAQLSKQLSELTTFVHSRGRDRSRGRADDRNDHRSKSRNGHKRNYKEPLNNMCFYHTNFGARARKCKLPCTFNSLAEN
nr:uncharacterized protein LOC122272333 [Parasteatoda tepidariorum]